jgi:hypothetical protein
MHRLRQPDESAACDSIGSEGRVPMNEVVYYRVTERLGRRCSAITTAFCKQNAGVTDDGSARSTFATMLPGIQKNSVWRNLRARSDRGVPSRFVHDLLSRSNINDRCNEAGEGRTSNEGRFWLAEESGRG